VAPNFTTSQSAIRRARRVFTSIALRMKARRLSQMTSIPRTSMMAFAPEAPVTSSRNIRAREVT
jgi:hypothetical protein